MTYKNFVIGGVLVFYIFVAGLVYMSKYQYRAEITRESNTKAISVSEVSKDRGKCGSTSFNTYPIALSCVNNADYSKVICTICQAGYKCVIFDANNCRY